MRKIQDERAEIKKLVDTNNTLLLKGKTQENIIDFIQKHKDEFIKHAEFPTDKNANKNNEISFLNSKLDKTKLQSALDKINR